MSKTSIRAGEVVVDHVDLACDFIERGPFDAGHDRFRAGRDGVHAGGAAAPPRAQRRPRELGDEPARPGEDLGVPADPVLFLRFVKQNMPRLRIPGVNQVATLVEREDGRRLDAAFRQRRVERGEVLGFVEESFGRWDIHTTSSLSTARAWTPPNVHLFGSGSFGKVPSKT